MSLEDAIAAKLQSQANPDQPAADTGVTDEQRQRIAVRAGIPIGLAGRLQGTTPAEIAADAAKIGAEMRTRSRPRSLQEAFAAHFEKNPPLPPKKPRQ